VALGQVFSDISFPYQFSFRLLHIHYLSPRAGTIGQTVGDIRSGLSLTPPQGTTETTIEALRWRFKLRIPGVRSGIVDRSTTVAHIEYAKVMPVNFLGENKKHNKLQSTNFLNSPSKQRVEYRQHKKFSILGYDAVQSGGNPLTFRRNILSPSFGLDD
jgi:hypothetical protein